MSSAQSPVDLALPAVRALFAELGSPFKLVGGVAVVHHGYARTTVDIDVLVDSGALASLSSLAAQRGFAVEARTRLRHLASGVEIDLLVAGEPMPRPNQPVYPAPAKIAGSPSDADVVGLGPLLELKLRAHRHQDVADVVELLKRVDDARYQELEAGAAAELRPELSALRRDALEELALAGG